MLICVVVFPVTLFAQATTQVNIVGIPPILPSPFISSFEQNVFNGTYQVQLNITGTSAPVDVEFIVELYKDGQRMIEEVSLPVRFSPGFHMLSPFPDFVEFTSTTNDVMQGLPSSIFRQVLQSGAFPEGDYSLVIRADRVGGGTSQTAIPGTANFMVRYPQPPYILTPQHQENVLVNVPVFSWTPAIAPAGTSVEYEILIVELYDGQNPGDAILSNREHASTRVLNSTSFPYTGEFLPLEEGTSYAWQVTAKDAADQIPFKNEGRSEVFVFTFGETSEDDDTPPLVFEGTWVPQLIPSNIPVTTIAGTVNWRFRPFDTSSTQPSNQQENIYNLPYTNNYDVANAIDDVNYVFDINDALQQPVFVSPSLNIAAPEMTANTEQAVSGNAMVPVFGGGTSTGAQMMSVDATQTVDAQGQQISSSDIYLTHPYAGAKVSATVKMGGYFFVIASTTADENGDYILAFAPSELAELAFPGGAYSAAGSPSGVNDNVSAQNLTMNAPGMALANELSSGSAESGTSFADVTVHINVDSNDLFDFSGSTTLQVNPNKPEFYQAGTLTGTALTYQLNPKVTDADTGNEIPNASIEVFRAENFYETQPALRPEGAPLARDQRDQPEQLLGNTHIKIAEQSSDNLIFQLFPKRNGFTDRYAIRISAPGYETYTTHFSAGPATSLHQIITVDKTYELMPGAPAVIGRVIREDNQAPLHNVSVTLHHQNTQYSAVTDSDGGFTISGIDRDTQMLTLTVFGTGIQEYQEEIVFEGEGMVVERNPIAVNPAMVTVTGKIENDLGEPVANATVMWEDGGAVVYTDYEGNFETANTLGTHLLKVKKIGHQDGEKEVNIIFGLCEEEEEEPSSFNLQQTGIQASVNANQPIIGPTIARPCGTTSAGTITINRRVGKLLVTVQNQAGSQTISDATVAVGEGDVEGTTGEDGTVYFGEAPGGNVPLRVQAPLETNFVPLITEVSVSDAGDTTFVTLQMELGGRAQGTVLADGQPVENATIRVEGREDIFTGTDEDGTYVLPGIPVGEWELKASKSGFVSQRESAEFSADETETLNFELGDAGFAISNLLGFEIEVDDFSISSDTTISGAFVSIPSNDLFDARPDLLLKFSDIKVYEEDGQLYPVEGHVVTDNTVFRAKVFDLIYLKIKNNNGLVVRPRTLFGSSGYIAGQVEIDYATTYTSITGWKWNRNIERNLSLPNTGDLPDEIGDKQLVVLTSDGSFPYPDINANEFEFTFDAQSDTLSLFGFDVEINLAESVLNNEGFQMSGNLKLSDIPLIEETGLNLEKLWIGLDGSVREATLRLDPKPQISLGNWELELDAGTIMETGLLLGGMLAVNLPGSDVDKISFSQLGIASGMIHGGQFIFPEAGIDLFGIAELTAPEGTEVNFGKVQGEDVYFISGSAELELPKYIDETIAFNNFYIRTDGRVDASAEANFKTDFFELAEFSVSGVQFANVDVDDPFIRIDGQIDLTAIPNTTAQASGLIYRPGGSVMFEEMYFGFDLSSFGEVGVGIGLIDEPDRKGFSGSGKLEIKDTPIDAEIDFFYEKRQQSGIAFGATIQTGIPPIPVGSFFLEDIGGGFSYDPVESFSVTLLGKVVAAPGTDSAIALDPLSVTVRAGPVIEGFAALSVIGEEIAQANLRIDFPQRFFDIEATLGFEGLEGVDVNASAGVRIVLSGMPNNAYWMAGAYFRASMLGLFDANSNILAAWNVPQAEYPDYTDFVQSDFVQNGRISGLHLDVGVEFGRPQSNPACVKFGFGRACGYFYNKTVCQLNADLGGGNFGLFLGSNWEAGGYLRLLGADVAGVNVWAYGEIYGSYINNIWSAGGRVEGGISAFIGNCNIGCNTRICFSGPIPVGASLCGSAAIIVDYRSNRGMNVSVSLNANEN